jgi:hypothetical protein
MTEENANPKGGNADGSDNPVIPKYRLDEEIAKRKEFEEKLAKFEAERKAEQERVLAEQGKFKEIADTTKAELDAMKREHEQALIKAREWEDYQKQKREALLEKLPEDRRSKYGTVELSVLEDVVELTSKQNPNDPKGRSGVHPANGGYDSLVEFATKDPEGYEKYKAQMIAEGKWAR